MPISEVDKIGNTASREFESLLAVSVDDMMKDFANGEPLQLRSEYLVASTDITTTGIITATDYGIGESYLIASIEGVNEYYLSTPYKSGVLSERLYKNSVEAQKAVTGIVSQHIKDRTTWQNLAKGVNKPSIRADELPQYITDVENAFKKYGADSKELKSAIKRANRQIAKFSNAQGITRSNLKRAYADVLKMAEKGDTALLKYKMTEALKKKAINNSEMLAKTEISRAYFEAEQRKLLNDSDVIGWRSVLSSAHPRPDICNFMAEADNYGMGRGVSPVAYGNPIGYHPRCICQVEAVYKGDGIRKGKFRSERAESYLQGLSNGTATDRKKLQSMLGVEGSKNIGDWQQNLRGFSQPQKLAVLPNELIVKA
ncbi:MAG: hypothetical protein U9N61_01670 [Euryarchaeota archaeon]|nr:hypothetical protein [Euryarchaeota archaeon]